MFELALGLAMICSEAAVVVEEDQILSGAVELTLPRRQWDKEARAVCVKHRIDCARTVWFTEGYYDAVVAPALRDRLEHWDNDGRVWLCSEGKAGCHPGIWTIWNLGRQATLLRDEFEEEVKRALPR